MSGLTALTFAYIYIPILIFLWGWTKPWIAGLCTMAILYSLYRFRTNTRTWIRKDTHIDIKVMIVVIIFFAVLGYIIGGGAFTQQAGDWYKHNSILLDLTWRDWPVYYRHGSEHSMLTYYIAMYLVPALVGKVVGSYRVAEIALYIWSLIGLLLVFLNTVRVLHLRRGVAQLIAAFLICMFSTPLYIAQMVNDIVYKSSMLFSANWFSYSPQLQYSDNYTLLRWVVPQVLVLWLTVLLLIE